MLNIIHHTKCEDGLALLPDESVALFVTSPPYGGLRKYKGFSWDFETVAAQMCRVLKPGGIICWNTGDQIIKGQACLYPERQKLHFVDHCGLLAWDNITWVKHGVPTPTSNRYYNTVEPVFVFSKGKPGTLNLLKDRVNLSAGRKEITHKRSSRDFRARSAQPTYITAENGRRTCVWQYPNEQNTTNHPAVMNYRLALDLVLSYSNEGDVVCDPFAGSGTTLLAAQELGREWVGFEISEEYIRAAYRRMTNLFHQPLEKAA